MIFITGHEDDAAQATVMQAGAFAFFIKPLDDIKFLAAPVYRHRIILKPEAEIEGLNPDRAIARILARVPVPR